jgi:hypothetical protein
VVRGIGIARLPVMHTMLEEIVALMGEVKLVFIERRP